MLKTKQSNPNKPARILIYGIEGVGKSTLGANADKPIFITPEGGADHLKRIDGVPVDEMTGITTWDTVRKAVKDLLKEDHDYKTCVIDSADWLEKICHAKIIGASNKDIIRVNGGYSAGLRDSERMHRELIEDLSELRDKRGMNIIVTAHYQVKEVKDPDMMEDYDGYQIKCDERVSSLWREWVEALLFARFKTYINKNDNANKKARAIGDDSRVVYTIKRPAFQAKNRYGLPPEMDFTENFWNVIKGYIAKGIQKPNEESLEVVLAEVNELMAKVEDDSTQAIVKKTIEERKGDVSELKKIRLRLRSIVGK